MFTVSNLKLSKMRDGAPYVIFKVNCTEDQKVLLTIGGWRMFRNRQVSVPSPYSASGSRLRIVEGAKGLREQIQACLLSIPAVVRWLGPLPEDVTLDDREERDPDPGVQYEVKET